MRVYRNEKLRALALDILAPRIGDAGYDIYAVAEYDVAPMQRVVVDTGLHLEIPTRCVGLVKDRSSVAAAGLHCLAGVIDSSYRGELKVLIVNLGHSSYRIQLGQRIAQLLLVPVRVEAITLVDSLDELSSSERGTGRFGSTGE